MAGEASEAVARRARTSPDRLGDTSIPGDRTHPGAAVDAAVGARRIRRQSAAVSHPFHTQWLLPAEVVEGAFVRVEELAERLAQAWLVETAP
jgi:hypothetical protein